ncbi:MAG: hypothetical protein Q9227_007005 [Pyrenula ochraceoflavens]
MLSASRVKPRSSSRRGETDEESDEDELRAFSFFNICRGANVFGMDKEFTRSHHSILLAVVPTNFYSKYPNSVEDPAKENGCVVCFPSSGIAQDTFAPRLIPSRFDSGRVLQWLDNCKNFHQELCSRNLSPVRGLKLIDCERLTVVDGPDRASYFALSYVWGNSKSSPLNDEGLPENPPHVLSDAIAVTKALEMRYLWVDKYCINQDDKETKLQQINSMDFIYENADLTIVAAAGFDENYGLPGVGCRLRKAQVVAKSRNAIIASIPINPQQLISSSRWMTRGWTYQEAVLSTRLLAFTDEQIYFECNSMNCCESVSGPPANQPYDTRTRYKLWFPGNEIFRPIDDMGSGSIINDNLDEGDIFRVFEQAIVAYTARDLRFDSDSLNAFSGIIRKIGRQKIPVMQLQGIPLLLPGTLRFEGNVKPGALTKAWQKLWGIATPEPEQSKAHTSFLFGLSWRHQYTCWDRPPVRPRRRPEFPSWSWAGWAGKVEFSLVASEQLLEKPDPYRPLIEVEVDSDHIAPLEAPETFSPQALRFNAHCVLPSGFSYSETRSGSKALFFLDYALSVYLSEGPESLEQFSQQWQEGQQYKCIYIKKFWIAGTYLESIMVLKSNPDGTYSRIGMLEVNYCPFREFKKYLSKERMSFRLV